MQYVPSLQHRQEPWFSVRYCGAIKKGGAFTILGSQKGCHTLTGGIRPATEKYLTRGSSGVAGLKTFCRYEVVKLAYAGESTVERSKVVKEDGKALRENEEVGFLVAVVESEIGASSSPGFNDAAADMRALW